MSSRGHTQSSSRRDGFSSLNLKYLLRPFSLMLMFKLQVSNVDDDVMRLMFIAVSDHFH